MTANFREVDGVIGPQMGADDYIAKPFGSRELIARIRAVLRRSRDLSTGSPDQRPTEPRYQLHTETLVGSDALR
ncbi:hypothetical protein BC361_26535 [Ensifer sp. LC54]|nr:hypothetical protein BC361_26535 [Ensifer sp. LC54]